MSLNSGSDLDNNIQQLMFIKSKNVGMGDNTTASGDGKFMNNFVNDLTSLKILDNLCLVS